MILKHFTTNSHSSKNKRLLIEIAKGKFKSQQQREPVKLVTNANAVDSQHYHRKSNAVLSESCGINQCIVAQ